MPFLTQRRALWLIFGIILVGWGLRFFGYFYSPFYHHHRMGDEVEAYRKAHLFLIGNEKLDKNLTLDSEEEKARYLGSAYMGRDGLLPGPWQNRILAWGLKLPGFNGSIEGAHLLTLLFHCLILLLVAHGTWLVWGREAAVLTTAMSATFFYPVFYSFGLWHPHNIAVCATLVFYPMALYHKSQHWLFLGLAAMAETIFFQFHLIGAFLIFFVGFYFLLLETKKLRFTLTSILGICLALFIFYPTYLKHEWLTHFDNFKRLMDNGLFNFEVIKIPSNMVVMGSAELSGVIIGGWRAYQNFLTLSYGSFIVGILLILPTLALPLWAYWELLQKTFFNLVKLPVRTWLNHFKEQRDLYFLAGWLFVPWLAYALRLKYHELRFVALDYPVMYIVYSLAILSLAKRCSWKMLGPVVSLIFLVQIYSSIAYMNYGRTLLGQEPHLIYSLRIFDRIEQEIDNDLGHPSQATYSFEVENWQGQGREREYYEQYLHYLRQQINLASRGRLTHDVKSISRYALGVGEMPHFKKLATFYGATLYKRVDGF